MEVSEIDVPAQIPPTPQFITSYFFVMSNPQIGMGHVVVGSVNDPSQVNGRGLIKYKTTTIIANVGKPSDAMCLA